MIYKYIILGAGPAGLTFANLLKQSGEKSFILMEAAHEAGGLCRSMEVDKAPLDIGGGHFLDVRIPKVNEFLFQFMPENEWNLYIRDSKIHLGENYIDHPLEANIWQMDLENQIDYLESIAQAGCVKGNKAPDKFIDWIYWKLGDKIAEEYMLPYNMKMFSSKLSQLGIYWLEKLPDVSFRDTLKSCLVRKAFGMQPGHTQFYYPKRYGYGELWKRMAEVIQENVVYNMPVKRIDFETRTIYSQNGEKYQGQSIITTIPWREWEELGGMPIELQDSIMELQNNSIQIDYFEKNIDTTAHWIYEPNQSIPYHRILVRSNFCSGSRGYWTETNEERRIRKQEYSFYNKYAYPLNTYNKPEIMTKLVSWCEKRNVYPLGRWGEHQHYNSDVTVLKAMQLFERIDYI